MPVKGKVLLWGRGKSVKAYVLWLFFYFSWCFFLPHVPHVYKAGLECIAQWSIILSEYSCCVLHSHRAASEDEYCLISLLTCQHIWCFIASHRNNVTIALRNMTTFTLHLQKRLDKLKYEKWKWKTFYHMFDIMFIYV